MANQKLSPRPKISQTASYRRVSVLASPVLQETMASFFLTEAVCLLTREDGSCILAFDGTGGPVEPEGLSSPAAPIAVLTGQTTIIEDCHNKGSLPYDVDIATPVFDGKNKAISVLSLILEIPDDTQQSRQTLERLRAMMTCLASLVTEHYADTRNTLTLIQQLDFENRLAAILLSSIDDALLIVDSDGSIINVNGKAQEIFASEGDLLRSPFARLFVEHTHLSSMILTGSTIDNLLVHSNPPIETSAVRRPWLISSRPITDDRHVFIGSIVRVRETEHSPRGRRSDIGYAAPHTFDSIIGTNPALLRTKERAIIFSSSRARILIVGSIGTGKETFAQAIHNAHNPDKPYIACNCAAMKSEVALRILFGSSDEDDAYPSMFERADGGTLHLDQIDDLPLPAQAMLLRVLDENIVQRIGGSESYTVDFRLICSASRDLEYLVANGQFREDLYYRISSTILRIPPLSERKSDIILLADYFIRHYCEDENIAPITYTEEVRKQLRKYSWPGNVRELRTSVRFACEMCVNSQIELYDLPEAVREAIGEEPLSLAETETLQIERALDITKGNVTKAAKLLGMGRSTLYLHLKERGIETRNYKKAT